MKRLICAIFGMTILITPILVMAAEEEKGEVTEKFTFLPADAVRHDIDFSYLKGMPGFSDLLLNTHFVYYRRNVKNVNRILDKLNALVADNKDRSIEYAELKRRLGYEVNGVLLHEYYFENLGGKELPDPKGILYKKITEDFGSFEKWKKDFISTGMMRGVGWVVLYWEPKSGKLINAWVNEYDTGNFAGAKPLLVMDVFEHAYLTDYSIERIKYIEAFFKNIDWKAVEDRFKG